MSSKPSLQLVVDNVTARKRAEALVKKLIDKLATSLTETRDLEDKLKAKKLINTEIAVSVLEFRNELTLEKEMISALEIIKLNGVI
jgi:hypothetical protein